MNFVKKRKIDEMGRLVLPFDHRNYSGIAAGDPILITETKDGILISKSTECTDEVKNVDALGRIIIPKRIRTAFKITPKSSLEIHATNEGILLKLDTTDRIESITAQVSR